MVSQWRVRQLFVDLLVRQLKAPSLFEVELDRNRLVAAVQEHVPSVRMALNTLVTRDVQHGRTLALAISMRRPRAGGVASNPRSS